jgi:catechol 2,3-dioxygenase-like lactoylglutathione lyase family enzyme
MSHQDKQNTSIDHLIIVVPDLQKATEQYATLLGRSPSWQGSHPDYGTANTLFQLDNVYLELLAVKGSGPAADIVQTLLNERGSSLGGLVFGTQDASAFIERARSFDLMASDPVPGQGIDDNTRAQRHWRNIFWDAQAARGIFSFCIEHSDTSSLPMSEKLSESPVTAVDHVVVKTQSAAAAKRFYGEQLGIRLALEQAVPEWGGTQLFFRASSMSIEVIASDKAPTDDDLWGLALKTADIEATHRRLLSAGVSVTDVKTGRKPGTRVCTVTSHTLAIPTLLIEHPVTAQ